MEELAQVYAHALFEVAQEHGVTDDVREQLGQFADELESNRDLQVFFFSPYFSSQEKKDGISRLVDGADERFLNFLELLSERHRMPVLMRVRSVYDALWREENKLLPVTVTSAIDLDEGLVRGIGERIEEQTGKKIELTSRVNPDVLGGLVLQVGNMVLDASIRNRLEQLRKQVAKAA
jgi:F-type H+-transporting ATPase subunit delta